MITLLKHDAYEFVQPRLIRILLCCHVASELNVIIIMLSLILLTFLCVEPILLSSHPLEVLRTPTTNFGDEKKCKICLTVSKELENLLDQSQSQECIAAVITDLCNKMNLFTKDVCSGVAAEYSASIQYSLQNKIFDPEYLCGTLVGEQCSNDTYFEPWNVTFPNTTKPNWQQPTLPPPNTRTYRVVHLSDIHYDRYYAPGTEANCDEPLCCRNKFGPGKNITAGFWGTAAKCDTPIWTIENLFAHLRDNEKWDWMMWTGDMPPHDIWEQTKNDQIYVLNTVYGLLYDYLFDRQIYLAVGNHESAPCNSFPPHYANLPAEYDISWLYNILAANWSNWISPIGNPEKDIKEIASYVTQVMPGLRLISLNTQYCIEGNFWLYANQTDPDGSLAWLIDQLQAAEDANEKVHIIGHVPSGDHTCLRHWSANYYDVINRYENTVVGQFFGHTHSDQFSVFYDNADYKDRPTNIMYIAPSVTTFSWRTPTYRVYTVDAVSFEVLDHETYMLNLTEANETNKTEWILEYSAKDAYGLQSLFPADWNNLIQTLSSNKTLFNQYYSYFDRNDKVCDESCEFDRLCEMRSGRSHDKKNLCSDLPYYNSSAPEVVEDGPAEVFTVQIPPQCKFAQSTVTGLTSTTATPPATTGSAWSNYNGYQVALINLVNFIIVMMLLCEQ